jgi:lipopolysaccharide/colanic/teichoic acid biosynthesis glycosyltransferase
MRNRAQYDRGITLKRTADILLSLIGLVFTIPLSLLSALLVKTSSPGPILYRAVRAGRGGRPFTMYKFRTMVPGADLTGVGITAADDDRVTRTGRWLRKLRLDELPQLFNVLKGDMSMVGPRPEDPRFVDTYDERQRRVLDLRPGITGLAQLEFSDESSLLDPDDPGGSYIRDILPRKLAVDLYYIRHRSLALDLDICLRTLLLPLHRRR